MSIQEERVMFPSNWDMLSITFSEGDDTPPYLISPTPVRISGWKGQNDFS